MPSLSSPVGAVHVLLRRGLDASNFVRAPVIRAMTLQGFDFSPVSEDCEKRGLNLLRFMAFMDAGLVLADAGPLEELKLPMKDALLVAGLLWRLRSRVPGLLVCDDPDNISQSVLPALSKLLNVPYLTATCNGDTDYDADFEAYMGRAQKESNLVMVCSHRAPLPDKDRNASVLVVLERLLVKKEWDGIYPLAAVARSDFSLLMSLPRALADLLVHC